MGETLRPAPRPYIPKALNRIERFASARDGLAELLAGGLVHLAELLGRAQHEVADLHRVELHQPTARRIEVHGLDQLLVVDVDVGNGEEPCLPEKR